MRYWMCFLLPFTRSCWTSTCTPTAAQWLCGHLSHPAGNTGACLVSFWRSHGGMLSVHVRMCLVCVSYVTLWAIKSPAGSTGVCWCRYLCMCVCVCVCVHVCMCVCACACHCVLFIVLGYSLPFWILFHWTLAVCMLVCVHPCICLCVYTNSLFSLGTQIFPALLDSVSFHNRRASAHGVDWIYWVPIGFRFHFVCVCFLLVCSVLWQLVKGGGANLRGK